MVKEKILVVDDEEDILELIRFNLVREGYKVLCAPSGEEALSIAQSEIPDLMVLDLMLQALMVWKSQGFSRMTLRPKTSPS